MKPNNELFEIRVLQGKKTFSGYFTDADTLINSLKRQDLKNSNVYITVNQPNEACYARKQKDQLMLEDTTTSDNDIDFYDWLMVDLDPKRPSKVSSSEEELTLAKNLGNKIFKYMQGLGFETPLMAMSGNGVHLMYRVNLKNTKEHQNLMKQSLKALDLLFSTDDVDIDLKNANPSRICKLYGTLAQKGRNDVNRPHRMSYVIGNPAEIKVSDKKYLEKLCEIIPKEPEKPQKYNNYQPREFDLDLWLDKYGLRYVKKSWGDADKYVLDECPFDSNHKAPDSCILKFRNGAISFTCFHNSCSDHKWQDLRMMYEPDAYEKKQQYEEHKMFHSYNRDKPAEPKHIVPKEGESIWLTVDKIIHKARDKDEFIKTGITLFDRKFRGLKKKNVTCISGQAGSAKSTLMSQIILNGVQDGNNVATFSGELSDIDFADWMMKQAAGKSYVEPSRYEDYYNVPFKYQEKIAKWLDGHFWLYDNKYGFDYNAIEEQAEKAIIDNKLDLLCLDNLMAFDISDLSKDKYDAQSKFAWRLHELAMRTNTHVIVVCHPRKPTGLLGMYDISGSSDLVNAMDNIIFVYRNNQNFQNSYKQFFNMDWIGQGTNIWHCAKARFGSVDDSYNELFYEVETKRLKNDATENIVYGWNEAKQMELPVEKPKEPPKESEFSEATDMDDIPFD